MNNQNHGPAPGADQSALSLLVNAADSHDPPRPQRENTMSANAPSLADTLRLRGLSSGGASLEEQLLFQQQQHQQQQQSLASQHGLLAQLRDQNLLSQLNQHQLASLLGLGGTSSAPAFGGDMRSALAAAQLRQQAPQLSQADLIALSRSGGLAGLSSLFGGGGGGLPSDLDGQLQRLEELERQQRLLSAASSAQFGRGGARMPRETLETSQIQSMSPQLRRQMPEEPPQQQQKHHHQQQRQQQQQQQRHHRPAMNHSEAAQHEGDASHSVPENVPKEEVEKVPGSVIVPCRARGMPMDHNFKTAYFVIPENVKHGEELICSYFACRNAGIKFRYCSHCKVPVAKRNFRKRHKHGGVIVAGEDSGAEDDGSAGGGPPPSTNKKGIPSQIMASREEPEEADALSSQTSNSANQQQREKTAEETAVEVQRGLVRSSMRTFEANRLNKPRTGMAAPADGGQISSERRERWEALLIKRPSTKDGDSMSNWLMEVLSVSDLETPLKPAGEDSVSAAAAVAAAVAREESKEIAVEEDEREAAAANVGSGVVIKKKRPAELLESAGDRPGTFAGGSFAEWKERKKQRKLAKSLDPTQEEEV